MFTTMLVTTPFIWSIPVICGLAAVECLGLGLRCDFRYVIPCGASKRPLPGDGVDPQEERLRLPGFRHGCCLRE